MQELQSEATLCFVLVMGSNLTTEELKSNLPQHEGTEEGVAPAVSESKAAGHLVSAVRCQKEVDAGLAPSKDT